MGGKFSLTRIGMEETWLMKKIYLPNIGHSEEDEEDMIRIVVISDTHGAHKRINVPPGSYLLNILIRRFYSSLHYTQGDILIHAGDFTKRGLVSEIVAFNEWLATLPHKVNISFP